MTEIKDLNEESILKLKKCTDKYEFITLSLYIYSDLH